MEGERHFLIDALVPYHIGSRWSDVWLTYLTQGVNPCQYASVV